MSDARALLRAKRQAEETRISHPYASYTPSKQLKCNVCDVIVKHASAWEGHLGSKGHRTAVAQQRKLLQQQQQQQRELEAAAAAASLDDHDEDEGVQMKGKRKASMSGEDLEAKKRRTGSEALGQAGGFPADFFSDPSRQVPVSNDDEEEEGDGDDAMAVDSATAQQAAPQVKTAIDEEYERFQRELMAMQEKTPVVETHEAFARATVVAEEELFTEQQKSGFDLGGGGEEDKAEEETEEQKRQRKEREERELIMDRLLEEERLQEDCDMRVASMKAGVEALKKKREMRKAAKTQGKS